MRKQQIVRLRSKPSINNSPIHPKKWKVHVILVVVTFPLLCTQVALYQRHTTSHRQSSHQLPVNLTLLHTEPHPPVNVQVERQETQTTRKAQDLDSQRASQNTTLPEWIVNYVIWHKKMRQEFPGRQIVDNPQAPKIVLRTCLGLCGGLNDRLGQLPLDLFIANQTNRFLMMHWSRPVPLEQFLVPPLDGIDWRVPNDLPGFFPRRGQRTVSREQLRIVRDQVVDMFEGYESANPTENFWKQDFAAALERATVGEYAQHKILRHRILGHLHEEFLEERLRALGETDMIHNTESFGNVFRLFFQPSPPIQEQLEHIFSVLDLHPGQYSAVHCRVRHPKAVVGLVKGKNENHPADRTGLPWISETRENAIETANRALQCARTLRQETQDEQDPIYFLSDSNDLVRYVSSELYNSTFVKEHKDAFTRSSAETQALAIARSIKILSRPSDEENAHIDRQKGREAQAYYGTFLDLFLAINARCVTYGVGFYAVFATKISFTPCKLLYQDEAWGANGRKRQIVPHCHLESDS